RGTIHLFSAKDYHWMMDLIAPTIDKIWKPYRAKLDLTEEELQKAIEVVSEIVSEQAVTRKDLAAHLATKDLPSAGIVFAQLLVYLSSRKGICLGPDETFRYMTHILVPYTHLMQPTILQ
ncbi:DNA glycosylase AlkZ-like family protein, partial [Listeria monocytogenes]|uniref:DNA glycosylase AlkZ-like family protein n=1 Tax=Listeria monocytogenes TaxID=1639 RepID=UPI000AE77100